MKNSGIGLPSKSVAKKMPTPSPKNLAKSLQHRTVAKCGAKVSKKK
jgi:hypothetical protein